MKARYTRHFLRQYAAAPAHVRKAFDKQLRFLEQTLRHPGLRAKKYDESRNLWQARVNKDWRFYFFIQDDAYLIVNIIPHPK